MKILIAEDDRTSRTMLGAVLQKYGHEVVATEDGEQAWRELQAEDAPRLAILDWMMPLMDGLEVCHRVRQQQRERSTYLIMLTTRDCKEDIAAGLDAGADDYLTKPYHPGELRARVEVGMRLLAATDSLQDKVAELQEAMAHIQTLEGILPICMHCKSIRDDQGYWRRVEAYLAKRTGVEFTHSLCPDCVQKLYPDLAHHLLRDNPDPDAQESPDKRT